MASKFEIFIDVFIGIFILTALIAPLSSDIGTNLQEVAGYIFGYPLRIGCGCVGADLYHKFYGKCSSGCVNAGMQCLQDAQCRPCSMYGGCKSTTTTTVKTTTTLPSPTSDICSSRADCSSCTYWVAYAKCGWCKNLGQCKKGTQMGPDDGSCSISDWIRYKNNCPQEETPSCYSARGICQSSCTSNQENLGKLNCYVVCCRDLPPTETETEIPTPTTTTTQQTTTTSGIGGSLCRSAGGLCASSCPSGLSLGKLDCYIICCRTSYTIY